MTKTIKYNKSIEELVPYMTKGGKIAHEEWCDDEYITIKNGYFVDENGDDFVISPNLLVDQFAEYGE